MRRAITTVLCVASVASASGVGAQERGADEVAASAIRAAATLAMTAATRDSAVTLLFFAAATAERAKEASLRVTALRGAASLLELRRPCTDSAEKTLRLAVGVAEPGDRSAADALVRLLASRGRIDEARRVLVSAYADVPGLGRAITRESARYLQGQAAVELAGGHEAAALSALSQALSVARRLSSGDARDSSVVATGADVNDAWIAFDLAMLRLTARSPSIRAPREAYRQFALLESLPPEVLEGGTEQPHPTMRLGDRASLVVLAACARNGATCPPPAPRGC